MMDKSYISKQESGNLESTRSRKISTYLSVKEARTIKETRTPAIASNFNSTSVKALSFDVFKFRSGYLAFGVEQSSVHIPGHCWQGRSPSGGKVKTMKRHEIWDALRLQSQNLHNSCSLQWCDFLVSISITDADVFEAHDLFIINSC